MAKRGPRPSSEVDEKIPKVRGECADEEFVRTMDEKA
jgi:hypothetical protein